MQTTDQKIRWMNSLTNATSIVSKLIEKSSTDISVKDELIDLANWYYLLEPANNSIEDKIESCNSKEELSLLKDEISATQDKNVFARFNKKIIELNDRESKTVK